MIMTGRDHSKAIEMGEIGMMTGLGFATPESETAICRACASSAGFVRMRIVWNLS